MIGIFLTKRNFGEGGGKTFTDEIFYSFIKTLKKNDKNYIFIISNDLNKNYIKALNKKKLIYREIYENNFIKKILIFICHQSKIANFLINKLNILKINNLVKKNKCKLIWFLSSEYREPIDIPYISTVWDMQFKTHPQFDETGSFFKKIFKEKVNVNFIKNSRIVITGTKIGKKQIIDYTNYRKEILILPHPVSNDFLKSSYSKIKKIDKLFLKKKYFFYPANFWKHKNHLNLIYAFNLFQKKNPDYNLVLTGSEKNNYLQTKKVINKFNLNKKVYIFRYVSIKKLIALYDNCHAVIYIPFSGPENLPPLEAMARKKLLINSTYPGAFEQLKNFPIYIRPHSIKSIHDGMIKSLQKSYKKKINKSFKYVRSKLSINYIIEIKRKLLELNAKNF